MWIGLTIVPRRYSVLLFANLTVDLLGLFPKFLCFALLLQLSSRLLNRLRVMRRWSVHDGADRSGIQRRRGVPAERLLATACFYEILV